LEGAYSKAKKNGCSTPRTGRFFSPWKVARPENALGSMAKELWENAHKPGSDRRTNIVREDIAEYGVEGNRAEAKVKATVPIPYPTI
jgi:hypothetical protein